MGVSPALRVEPVLALPAPAGDNLRAVSPRRFAEIVHELYLSGALTWAEFRMAGFPSELHPHYDATIGALTGERAAPDRPRDMLEIWERRVEFMRRFPAEDRALLRRAERILAVFTRRDGWVG
ncbi:MAG: hypothetical protein HY985_07885 [Magnetospirillum sp.]|nr:hypothetical protein [Magnetospirillum sp.]